MTATEYLLQRGIEPVKPKRKAATLGEAGYARRPHDAYFTEPWVTRSLLRAVRFGHWEPGDTLIWEPACGDGRMARPLREFGYRVVASDIADYGYRSGDAGVDFLAPDAWSRYQTRPEFWPDAIVTNPPFEFAREFIRRACEVTQSIRGKVAILQRHEFDAPASNHPLFTALPFAAKLVLHKRPRWSDDDKASPRFPYAWYLWDWRHQGPPVLRYLSDPDKAAPSGRLL